MQKYRADRLRVAMAGTLPPLFEITADDHGGYGAVAIYTLLALTVAIVSTRLSTRWFIGRVVHPDDILLGIAMVRSRSHCRETFPTLANIASHAQSDTRNYTEYLSTTCNLQWPWPTSIES